MVVVAFLDVVDVVVVINDAVGMSDWKPSVGDSRLSVATAVVAAAVAPAAPPPPPPPPAPPPLPPSTTPLRGSRRILPRSRRRTSI